MKLIVLLNALIGSFLLCRAEILHPFINVVTHQPPPIEVNSRAVPPTLHHIQMKVDNFNASDERTWNMRYYYNPQFCTEGGPILIYLGGEWSIQPNNIQGGQIFDIAREHGGCLFYTEHRFYGQSWPLKDSSTDSLRYLSVYQALVDVISFIRLIKMNPFHEHSKVVVVGGSYAGTMATWLRAKFPDVVDAAYSSSAPLVALDDFYQYFEVVSKNIAKRDANCWQIIHSGVQQMEKLMETSEGIDYLSYLMKTCRRIRVDEPHRSSFFHNIANYFTHFVQYAKDGSIEQECNKLKKQSGNAMEKIAGFISEKNLSCLGSYEDTLYWYSQTTLSESAYRQWFYQTCVNFGFFQTGSSPNQPFGRNWSSALNHRLCKDAFGSRITEDAILGGIARTNAVFGGLLTNATRVVTIHGDIDPWHAIGILHSVNDDAPAILVPETSHCADLASISPTDSPVMRLAKQFAKDKIAEWISN